MYTEYEPYEELANAIVRQAVDDYKKALHKLRKNPRNKSALMEISRLERFFHSGWYSELTRLDADQLLAGVRILVKKESVVEGGQETKRRVKKCMKEIGEILSEANMLVGLKPEDSYRLKALSLEALNRTCALTGIQEEADAIAAEAIRKVGFQVGE